MEAKELNTNKLDNNNGMIIRICEIEIYPECIDEYLIYAKEVALESIKKESDVISIYPMLSIKDNNEIRILEIYKNEKAYQKHIESPHFKKYKESTIYMVKRINIVDNYQIAPDNFKKIFKR